MEQHIFKVILFHCKGYGLQVGDSLVRISSDIHYANINAQTFYLFDDNGEIVCTLLKDRAQYESNDNQDRRIVNNRNGFHLEWDNDGSACCIYKEKKASTAQPKFLLFSFFSGVAISVIFWGMSYSQQIMDYRNLKEYSRNAIVKDSLEIVGLKAANTLIVKQNDSLRTAIEKLKTIKVNSGEEDVKSVGFNVNHGDIVRHKAALQSMDCDYNTVFKIRDWWSSLSMQEQDSVKRIYDFHRALHYYSELFRCDEVHEFVSAVKKVKHNDDLFSRRQIHVLERLKKMLSSDLFLHKIEILFRENKRNISFEKLERFIDKYR